MSAVNYTDTLASALGETWPLLEAAIRGGLVHPPEDVPQEALTPELLAAVATTALRRGIDEDELWEILLGPARERDAALRGGFAATYGWVGCRAGSEESLSTCAATLPDGTVWRCTAEGLVGAWRIWQQLSALAPLRGEGVKIEHLDDGDVSIVTVGAPLGTTCAFSVTPQGRTYWFGEQDAPVEVMPDVSSWPLPDVVVRIGGVS